MKHALIILLVLTCPPKKYFCWQVKAAVSTFGEAALEERVRACGWTELQIIVAKRCLTK